MSAPVLVTGAAGFIGYHVALRLLKLGRAVAGIDNLNTYYDVSLKEARLAELRKNPLFSFTHLDVSDAAGLDKLFNDCGFNGVIHLAAQAGVRYSLQNPAAYIQSNLVAFGNILECCRQHRAGHLVYASSSSVYGGNTKVPFSVHDNVDHPVSLYAATKKSNELMAHSYAHLFRMPCTGLRFFTVYGPWGRPDMAAFLFTRAILEGKPIDLFNEGRMRRDFTYIDDIAEGVVRVLDRVPQPDSAWNGAAPDPATSSAPYRIYNIGNHAPVELLRFVEILEKELGRKAQKRLLPMQPGDVPETFADVEDLSRDTGFVPRTPIEAGLRQFVKWYREYYRV
ncbi:MAG TPA: NAD-dependent epimerase [Planctomycetota bacterium]|nr:NAD-dependent epimerase [Planctomycetota bacterium]